MTTFGKCQFCEQTADLLDSHIIPSFVFSWLKKSSATGFIRYGKKMNVRQQDGLKLPFLCKKCEDLFSTWESSFAAEVFRPYHARAETRFDYGPWMAKFCVSMSWRTLAYLKAEEYLSELDEMLITGMYEALATWKSFLLGERTHPGRFEQHLLPMDAIVETPDMDLPKKINRYLLRASEIDIIHSTDAAWTYTKIGRLILVGFIREPEAKKWIGSKIHINRGRIAPQTLSIPDSLWEYIQQRALRMEVLEASVSDRQKAKIESAARCDEQRTIQSETFQALVADTMLRSAVSRRTDSDAESGA